jgi:ankyrin repeat protein
MIATGMGYLPIVQALIDGHAEVSPRNRDGHTALDIAVQENHRRVAQILRIHGIMQLLERDIAAVCGEMFTIDDMIYEAITFPEHSTLSALEIWNRTIGNRLLAIAKNSSVPCQSELRWQQTSHVLRRPLRNSLGTLVLPSSVKNQEKLFVT